ncbi:Short-chain dehydrogenase/reductase tropE [Colletotrichum siamense]|uniref:Short-chain dehydrogenase/reductase tropE n=1 Tax=Colletotrichum siamense TaxID=690259 RepID=UPI00187228FD|nr:Short-chain dehydrogenase/reductase tropE [Colletotrichum siamense]KAF5506093.1 Short-chain dehydrogenase/reductase tropE [Colletotrichum siamense]
MSLPLTIVLVTGANQGIGLEIARKLSAENTNYHIIMTGRRQDAIEKAAQELELEGHSVEPLVLDLTSDKSIEEAVAYVSNKYGFLDVLINNAGIGGDSPMGPWARKEWQKVFDTNVFGTFAVTDSFLPLLANSTKTKRIVFVSSELGSLAWKTEPSKAFVLPYKVYAASKTALNMVAVNLAAHYSQDPTWKINMACPGHCATNFTDFQAPQSAAAGAVSVCRLATLEPGGETGTFSNSEGTIPW